MIVENGSIWLKIISILLLFCKIQLYNEPKEKNLSFLLSLGFSVLKGVAEQGSNDGFYVDRTKPN